MKQFEIIPAVKQKLNSINFSINYFWKSNIWKYFIFDLVFRREIIPLLNHVEIRIIYFKTRNCSQVILRGFLHREFSNFRNAQDLNNSKHPNIARIVSHLTWNQAPNPANNYSGEHGRHGPEERRCPMNSAPSVMRGEARRGEVPEEKRPGAAQRPKFVWAPPSAADHNSGDVIPLKAI